PDGDPRDHQEIAERDAHDRGVRHRREGGALEEERGGGDWRRHHSVSKRRRPGAAAVGAPTGWAPRPASSTSSSNSPVLSPLTGRVVAPIISLFGTGSRNVRA